MRLLLIGLVLTLASQVFAHGNYTGYSGAPGRQTCAASCHGTTGGTIQAVGLPSSYTPGQVYTITIRHNGGSTIRNFNASVRVGTTSTNAGTIAAGLNCSVYNVSGETNGVHFTSVTRDSGRFTWTAPAAGTGTVRLYVAGTQTSSSNGPNTTLSLTSTEAVGSLPTAATTPVPANAAVNVLPGSLTLRWNSGTGATSRDFFFGTTNPPASIGNRTDTTYAATNLQPGTTYYWRVDERNAAGATTGTVWSFTTMTVLPVSNPVPAINDTVHSNIVNLGWTSPMTPVPTGVELKLGTTNPPPVAGTYAGTVASITDTLAAEGVYYWQIRNVYSWGSITGPVWSFSYYNVNDVRNENTIPTTTALAKVYPNPFNPSTTIQYSLVKRASVQVSIYDVTGHEVANLVNSTQSAGSYQVTWNGSNAVSGTYFYRLTVDGKSYTGEMMLLK